MTWRAVFIGIAVFYAIAVPVLVVLVRRAPLVDEYGRPVKDPT